VSGLNVNDLQFQWHAIEEDKLDADLVSELHANAYLLADDLQSTCKIYPISMDRYSV